MANETWSHKLDYILSVLGYSLGVSVIWKFPYMCARNGGGSFLIPYIIFTLTGSIPLTYLESFIGQYSQRNCFDAWQICPSLQGLAVGTMFVSWIYLTYSPVLLAWSLYYLIHSFAAVLPWTLCGQTWNTDNCLADSGQPGRSPCMNETMNCSFTRNLYTSGERNMSITVPAAEEFFRNNMLQITDGLDNMGTVRWPLSGLLVAVYLCIYLCVVKGIRISGKIVYITATAPYILVTVILIRACTLPGSVDGLVYFLSPDFEKLGDPKNWMEACGLAIYIMGIGFGSLVKMASHNPIKNKCLWDAVMLSLVGTGSLVFFGLSVFAVTGHLAFKHGTTMDSYSTSGFKLGFITYPEATALLPLPQLWSVLLFLMFITLGIDSTGGVYLLTLVEWFAFFPSLPLFAVVELAIVGWIYGTRRIEKAMYRTCGSGLPKIIAILWKYVCPCLFVMVSGYSVYSYRPPKFEDFVYAPWANAIGWILSVAVVSPVPVYFIWSVWKTQGSSLVEKMKKSLKPCGPWNVMEEEEGQMMQDWTESMPESQHNESDNV